MGSIVVSAIELQREDGTSVIISIEEAKDLYKELHKLFGKEDKVDFSKIVSDGPIRRDSWRDKEIQFPYIPNYPLNPSMPYPGKIGDVWCGPAIALQNAINCNDVISSNMPHQTIWQLQTENPSITLLGTNPEITEHQES